MRKLYEIYTLNSGPFDYLIVWFSTYDFTYSLDELSEEPLLKGKGTAVFDELLGYGNKKGRYVSCPFEGGKFDLLKCKRIQPSAEIEKLSAEAFKENPYAYEFSILSSKILDKLRAGEVLDRPV